MVIAPAHRAGDPGSIPGPGENFSLKLLNIDSNYLEVLEVYIYIYKSKLCQGYKHAQHGILQ